MTYPYKGHESPYSYTGSLILKVNIEENQNLKRIGLNTYSDVYVTYADAILGTEVDI